MIGYFIVAFLSMPVIMLFIMRTDLLPDRSKWKWDDWGAACAATGVLAAMWPFTIWVIACFYFTRRVNEWLDEKDEE